MQGIKFAKHKNRFQPMQKFVTMQHKPNRATGPSLLLLLNKKALQTKHLLKEQKYFLVAMHFVCRFLNMRLSHLR